MSTTLRLLVAVALVAAGLCLSAGLPQDAGASLSPEIARLAAMEGLWDTQSVVTGMPATRGFAKMVLLGRRWLIEESRTETDEGTIDGRAFTGWDASKQRYVRAWVNTKESRLNVVDLTWDESRKALVSDELLMDLGSGPVSVRAVLSMPDSDTIAFTATPVAPDSLPGLNITFSRNR